MSSDLGSDGGGGGGGGGSITETSSRVDLGTRLRLAERDHLGEWTVTVWILLGLRHVTEEEEEEEEEEGDNDGDGERETNVGRREREAMGDGYVGFACTVRVSVCLWLESFLFWFYEGLVAWKLRELRRRKKTSYSNQWNEEKRF